MITPDQKKLIKKLFERNCTEEDFDQLFKLVKHLPQTEAERVMKELWVQKAGYPRLNARLSEKMYANILARIDQKPRKNIPRTIRLSPVAAKRRRILKFAGVAAVLTLLIGASLWVWNNRKTTIATTFAQQRIIFLPDGSKVTLNANSTLSYWKNWKGKKPRKVWLDGEAFFEVTKKPETGQKFQVITTDLTVEVLGTVFNVNSWREQTSVFLEEGEIALRPNPESDQEKLMNPGEFLIYSAKLKGYISQTKPPNPRELTSWKDGSLIFEEGTPLIDILKKVEDMYGVTFEFEKEAKKQSEITCEGLPTKDINDLIEILELALISKGLEIHREGDNHYLVQ